MKKVKLNLDELDVESFDTTEEPERRRGTVFGLGFTIGDLGLQCLPSEGDTCQPMCGPTNDLGDDTCDLQCTGDNTHYTEGTCSCTGDDNSVYCISLAAGSRDLCDTVNNTTCVDFATCNASPCNF